MNKHLVTLSQKSAIGVFGTRSLSYAAKHKGKAQSFCHDSLKEELNLRLCKPKIFSVVCKHLSPCLSGVSRLEVNV